MSNAQFRKGDTAVQVTTREVRQVEIVSVGPKYVTDSTGTKYRNRDRCPLHEWCGYNVGLYTHAAYALMREATDNRNKLSRVGVSLDMSMSHENVLKVYAMLGGGEWLRHTPSTRTGEST